MSDHIFKWIMLGIIIVLIPVAAWEPIAEAFNLEFEVFARKNGGILVSLGTLGLVSLLALGTTLLANRFANLREASNRKIQSELKLSEFRQKWIDALRSDLASVISISTGMFEIDDISDRKEGIYQLFSLESKIRLRLNPDEPPAMALLDAVDQLLQSVEVNDGGETFTNIKNLADLATRYLKNEWNVLKDNLDKAEGKDAHI